MLFQTFNRCVMAKVGAIIRRAASVLTIALLTTFCVAQNKVHTLAKAIAKAEGSERKGTIPSRYRNPGDLKVVRGYRYPGQIGVGKCGHVIFRDNASGWAALEHQIDKMIMDDSERYSVNMTLQEFSRKYAGNHRVWLRNVAHNLGVSPEIYLWEILYVPPTLKEKPYATRGDR